MARRAGWFEVLARAGEFAWRVIGRRRKTGRLQLHLEGLKASRNHSPERNPKLDGATFDHGRGELPIDWLLSFIRSFGHVLGLFHI